MKRGYFYRAEPERDVLLLIIPYTLPYKGGEHAYLKAVFNYGMKRKLIRENPTNGIEFFPVEKKEKYVPPQEDILKVLFVADSDTRDYLYTIKDTMGRVGEINRLTWSDVHFDSKVVVLYTRKKR